MNDNAIVEALKQGKPEGGRELVRQYGDRLVRSAFLLCHNEADAQELAQDTLAQAAKCIHRYRGDAGFYTWMHGILLNLNRSFHRKKALMKWTYRFPTAQLSLSPDALYEAVDKELSPLAQALRMLPDRYREILILHFYEGMNQEEIGKHLRIPGSTVRTRLGRALRRLRKNVKP